MEDIKQGDKVLSYDTDTCSVVWDEVRDVLEFKVLELVRIAMTDNTVLTTTTDHPLYLPKDRTWACVDPLANCSLHPCDCKKLERGQHLLKYLIQDKNTTQHEVKSIEIEPLQNVTSVFTLSTLRWHNFFADDVLVHNKGGLMGPDIRSIRKVGTTDKSPYKFYKVSPGLNYEGSCKNRSCDVYNQKVITKRGFGDEIYPLYEEIQDKIKCPGCNQPYEVDCYNFYKCRATITFTRGKSKIKETEKLEATEEDKIVELGEGKEKIEYGFLAFAVTKL